MGAMGPCAPVGEVFSGKDALFVQYIKFGIRLQIYCHLHQLKIETDTLEFLCVALSQCKDTEKDSKLSN